MKRLVTCLIGAPLLLLAACSSTGTTTGIAPPENVPAALRAPAGQVAYLETLAEGVQIYECKPKADQSGAHEWSFRAPEATLMRRDGQRVGKHYAGPTWESDADKSSVVGAVKARDPGPDANAIPWLLLDAKSNAGSGVFAQTRSIQRLYTAGGVAPKQPCGAGNVGEVARVPYTATYYFYRSAP